MIVKSDLPSLPPCLFLNRRAQRLTGQDLIAASLQLIPWSHARRPVTVMEVPILLDSVAQKILTSQFDTKTPQLTARCLRRSEVHLRLGWSASKAVVFASCVFHVVRHVALWELLPESFWPLHHEGPQGIYDIVLDIA